MGQSDSLAGTHQRLSIFLTNLGWMGIAGTSNRVHRLALGHQSQEDVRIAFQGFSQENGRHDPLPEEDWFPQLRRQLQRYGQGEFVEFDDVHLVFPRLTAFQESIVAATRAIGYGQTVSYGELAELAGYSRAARAVGTVMSSNTLPILVPCHRVVGAAGKLGGYSAPQGISLKQNLLAMEAESVHAKPARA